MIVRQASIAASTVLADGDIGISEDTGLVKRGDGVTTWAALPAVTGGVVAALAAAIDDASGAVAIADVTGLQAALDGKAATVHAHAIADTTGLQAALDAKAALAGPAFTGVPTAPTAAPGTNTTQIATTAFVAAAAGGGVTSGSATVTMTEAAFEWTETVTATGVTGTKRVQAWLAPGDDADENTADMLDLASIAAAPGTDQITVTLTFGEPTSGPIRLQWSAF